MGRADWNASSGRLVPWFFGALALAFPALAQANAGIGMFLVASPFVVMALVPAILVEAPILSRLLRVNLGKGLWWSFLANLYSTVVGILIALAADFLFVMATQSSGVTMDRLSVAISLIPMFLITWWLEQRAIRRLQGPGAPQSPVRATLIANSVSYSLLALAVIFVPARQLDFPPAEARWRISDAMAEMGAARLVVEEQFAAHSRFPEPSPIKVKGKYLQSLDLDGDGRLAAVINYPGATELHGKRVILAPRVESGKIVTWDCYTPDAAHKYLPANCRQAPPPTGSR